MPSKDSPTPVLAPLTAWVVALAATSTMTVSYVDRQALSVLAPTITRALHIDETGFGWLGSAFSLAYLVGAPLAGWLVDRVGARRGLVASVLVWSAVAASHALAPGLWTLALLRVLLGLAEAPSFPSAAQTITRALRGSSRQAAFGVLFTGSSFGAAFAALLLPWLEERFGWRVAMLGTAVAGLSWIPLWIGVTSGRAARTALDRAPTVRRSSGGWRELLVHPAVRRALLAVLASAPVYGFVLQWGAKVLVARHGVPQAEVGHYLWLPPVLFDVGAVGFGALAAASGRHRAEDPPQRALFAAGAALLLAIGALGLGATPWATTLAAALAAAGVGGVYTLCTADALARVPPDRVASAGSLCASAQSLALIVAFPIVGSALDHGGSYLGVGLGLAAWAVPGTLAWLLWDPRPRALG